MRKIVILSIFLTIIAPITSGCAVALWAGTMAVGVKMQQPAPIQQYPPIEWKDGQPAPVPQTTPENPQGGEK